MSSAFIASVSVLSASLGCAPISVRTAPTPWVGGAPVGTEAAATASPASDVASALALLGSASRSEPHAGKFRPPNEFGLVCSPGSAAQLWFASAGCNSGRTASSTGDVTNERLSVMAF